MRGWSSALHDSLRDTEYAGQTAIDDPESPIPDVLRGVLSPDSHLSDRPSKSVRVPDKTPLLEVRQTHQGSIAARQAFVDAVFAARDAGFSNLRISCYCGMTEAGVRMLLKRSRRRR